MPAKLNLLSLYRIMSVIPFRSCTSDVEVSHISPYGCWLFLGAREVFLAFDPYPCFRDAPLAAIKMVRRTPTGQLHWPVLDLTLTLDMIESSAAQAGPAI